MNRYIVSFYYNTDQRWFEAVEATDELTALAIARQSLQSRHRGEWVDSPGFWIKVALA